MATDQPDIRCVLKAHARNGESPCWCEEEGRLYWIDSAGGVLHRFDPVKGNNESWEMRSHIGCAAPGGGGRVLVALQEGVGRFDTRTNTLQMLAPMPFDTRRFVSNDGKCDPQGRFWFGPMHSPLPPAAPDSPKESPLLRFDPGAREPVPVGALPAGTSNGLAWSPDGRTLYHAHTGKKTIYAYDFDGRDGTVSNERVFARVDSPGPGGPDGGATDVEGYYWSAVYGASKLIRFDPDGKIEREVALPVSRPTMPAFGGPGLRTLYVTSASDKKSALQRWLKPLDGGLFAFEAPVPGALVPLASARYFEETPG